MKKRAFLLALALCLSALAGCQREPVETTVFAMDTVMNLTLYGGWDREKTKETRDWMTQRLTDCDELFSAAEGNGDIARVNQGAGQPSCCPRRWSCARSRAERWTSPPARR